MQPWIMMRSFVTLQHCKVLEVQPPGGPPMALLLPWVRYCGRLSRQLVAPVNTLDAVWRTDALGRKTSSPPRVSEFVYCIHVVRTEKLGADPVAVVDQSFCFPFVLVFFPILSAARTMIGGWSGAACQVVLFNVRLPLIIVCCILEFREMTAYRPA